MAGSKSLLESMHLDRLGIQTRLTLLVYLLTFLSMGGVGYYGYTSAAEAYRAGAKDAVNDRILQISDKIDEFNRLIRNDLNFFSNNFSLIRQLYWLDMKDGMKHGQWKVVTVDTWLDFVKNHDYLYKLRFIGLDGRERIAIRRDPHSRQVRILSDHELQDRREESYFTKSIDLSRNAFHVSVINLNREHGRIEKPLVPVIRLARPVFGENRARYGVVVINIFAEAIFKYIRDIEKIYSDGTYYLLDENGEFLYHPDAGKSFAHLLGHGENFRTLFPGVLDSLRDNEAGARFTRRNVLAHRRIHPHPDDRDHYWTLVGTIDETVALSRLANFKLVFFSLVLVMLVLVFLGSHYFVGGLMRPLLFVTRQLQRLGRGRVEREHLPYRYRDEVRQMLDSTDRLVGNMEMLAGQADTIARGDFSSDVVLLSDRDRLGSAINNMTAMLRKNREEADRQNWLRDGIGRLNEQLAGDLAPQPLAERALSIIAAHIGAGRGVFFVYDTEQEALELLGSYMYTRRDSLSNRFKIGEGAVGQVARERKPITLTIRESDRAAPITTGTASVRPLHTHTWPLLREGNLLGVVELSGFEPLNDRQREFLDAAMDTAASFTFMALQRQRIAQLLEKSEESARRAREQGRQLRETNTRMLEQQQQLQQTNAQMEEQQQQLQQQTEELQQTNAQMEEQQQQLQQQTEELQQANAQMEEQRQQVEQQSEELRRNNEALRRSQEEINARARQLEEANRYKSDFLANMSHELRTPLNAIIVISKMMAANEEGRLDEENIKRAQVVHNAGNELLRLISDILDLSKIEAGRVELHPEVFSSGELAEEMKNLFEETSREKKVDWLVEDRFRGLITSDRHKIVQVVRNLLANAFKFTAEGRVTLLLAGNADPERPLKISVSDTGIGIPKGDLEKIFEAFRQVDGSISRQYGGTGLGLSISKRFVRLLGGIIEVRSVEDRGSEFILQLPVQLPAATDTVPAAETGTDDDRSTEREPEKDQPASDGREPTILVIDDDAHFLENITAINRHHGHRTLSAMSGEEGLTLARGHRPAGIILDLGLPDMPGETVLERLKTDPELKHIPVYIISARDKDHRLMERGAIGFLQKPVTDGQIVSAETTLLQALDTGPKRILVVEGPALKRTLVEEPIRHINGLLRVVTSVTAGLELLGSETFDLVLVDYRPAGMTCAAFCETLHDRQPNLPIIIYGADEVDEENLLQLRRFTDSIIQRAPRSEERVYRDIKRFLAAVAGNDGSRNGQPVTGADKKLNGRRILIVDDDPRNLFVLTASLEQNGATVIKALNGRKALELLARESVDLVFMDIMMPEMNGYETIRAIRADAATAHLPVIVLTAKALKGDRQKCLDAGADDYLSKPVDYEVLVNMAHAWVEKRS